MWVSRIVAIEPGASIEGELDVPADLDIFRGHFPDHPVLPGVIIMEALAQCASIAVLQSPELRGCIGFLTGIDAAKFRRQVAPGETRDAASDHREVVAPPRGGRGGGVRGRRGLRHGHPEVRARTQGVTMAKAASKYISFDTAGNFVSELADGPAAPEATEDGSLKSAISYALDAIVEAAGTLPDTAAALVGARAGATHRDPEEKVADVSEHVRSTIGDDFAVECGANRRAKPRALVIASAKNARAFVVPMEQAGLDVGLRHGGQPLAGRLRSAHAAHATTWAAPRLDVDADTLSANIYTVLSAAKACGAALIFLDSAKAPLAEDAYFLRHAAKRGLRVFAPATEGTLRTGWVELLPAGVTPALDAA